MVNETSWKIFTRISRNTKKRKRFYGFVFNSKLACDISLQPIERFDFDFIILFSDILVIPYALGQDVKFKENIGPILGNINYENLEMNLLRA